LPNIPDSKIDPRISSNQIEIIFRDVSKKRYKKAVDFSSLNGELSKLRTGGCLSYEHLKMIADPNIWPFENWWRWPDRRQIRADLKKTKDLFIGLDGLSDIHEERIEEEKRIFNILYSIFKHIELVSIILRFIDEENFAIYSPPVVHAVNSERGDSYTGEYINYLREIRKYKSIYGLEKAAYVDMFFWAIEVEEEREGILNLFHRKITRDIRNSAIKGIVNNDVFKKIDIDKARFYLDIEDLNTAAKWAASAIESAIREKCNRLGIHLGREGRIRTLGGLISNCPGILAQKKERIVELRNLAAHPSGHEFSLEEVRYLIDQTEAVEAII